MAVKPAISEVISNSPLALLERHAGVCVDCVERLPLYFEEAQAGRWGRAGEVREDICRFEGLADELKQDVRSNLPRGLWMSVSRADLLELVRVQDKVANGVKEVSGISLGRQLAFPAPLTTDLREFMDVVVDVSRTVVKIIGATRELSRSAFGTYGEGSATGPRHVSVKARVSLNIVQKSRSKQIREHTGVQVGQRIAALTARVTISNY